MFATGSVATTAGFATFPRNLDFSLFERVEVEINGQIIQQGCNNYGHLGNIIADMSFGVDCQNRRAVLQNGNGPPTNAGALNITASATAVPIAVTNWIGFFASISPQWISTSILGNVRLRLTMASNSVLIANAAATGAAYTLSNIYFTCDTASIDDGQFNQIHQMYLAQGGVYEYVFRQWSSYSSVPTSLSQTTNFSLGAQSLNRVLATFVLGGTAKLGTDYYDVVTCNSPYFTRFAVGSLTINANATTFNLTNWQFNLAGVYHPTYQADPYSAFALDMNSMHLSQDTLGGVTPYMTPANSALSATVNPWTYFVQNFWVAMIELEEGTDNSYISGLDTRGNVAQGWFTTVAGTGTIASPTCLVFCECTSSLLVGAGKQIQLVL